MAEETPGDGNGAAPPPRTGNVVSIDYARKEKPEGDPKDSGDSQLFIEESGWLDEEPPPRDWLIPQIIPAHRLGMLSGEGGIGKSRLVLQIAACLASGDADWLPGTGIMEDGIEPRKVAYLSYEDEGDEIERRIRSLGYSEPNKTFGDRFTRIRQAGTLWQPEREGSGHTSTRGEPTDTLHRIMDRCVSTKTDLLVIDPLGAAFLSNENDRGLVMEFCRYMDYWSQNSKVAVMFVAHPPKSDARYSGSTGWRNSVRWLMVLERAVLVPHKDKDKIERWPVCVMDKSNYGLEHGKPDWWLTTDRRRGMEPDEKVEVVDKEGAMAILKAWKNDGYGVPPVAAYEGDAEDKVDF